MVQVKDLHNSLQRRISNPLVAEFITYFFDIFIENVFIFAAQLFCAKSAHFLSGIMLSSNYPASTLIFFAIGSNVTIAI